jgi:hypothetical protein
MAGLSRIRGPSPAPRPRSPRILEPPFADPTRLVFLITKLISGICRMNSDQLHDQFYDHFVDPAYDQFKILVEQNCDPVPPIDAIIVYYTFEKGLRTFLQQEPAFLHPTDADIDDDRDSIRVNCIFTSPEFEYQQYLQRRYNFPPIPWPSSTSLQDRFFSRGRI